VTDRSYRHASCSASVAWARREGKLVPVADARTGDILVHLYNGRQGHTGMLSRPLRGNGRATTIEGNTSGSDDRDGGSVQERDRALSWWSYAIRLDLTPEERAAMVALARSQLGETEHPFGSNCTKFGAWYKFNCVAWCAIFLSWVVAHFTVPTSPTPEPEELDDMASTPAVVIDKAGRRLRFVRGTNDPESLWLKNDADEWTNLGGELDSGPSAAVYPDGRVVVNVVGTDGAVWELERSADGTWGSWSTAGGLVS
jgi:hypothetical protein